MSALGRTPPPPPPHDHTWQRLSDTALFCHCGETMQVAPAAFTPVYPYIVPCVRPHVDEPDRWTWPNTTGGTSFDISTAPGTTLTVHS